MEGAGTTSLTRLTALRRLTLRSCDCDTMAGADFSQMTVIYSELIAEL